MFELEHTKPLFNEYNLMSLESLYKFHAFMEVFKILKFDSPISLRELFTLSLRDHKLSVILPLVSTNKSRQNYVFKSASVWNELLPNILEKSKAGVNGIVIPGSYINSDLAASISNIKSRANNFLISEQKMGNLLTW